MNDAHDDLDPRPDGSTSPPGPDPETDPLWDELGRLPAPEAPTGRREAAGEAVRRELSGSLPASGRRTARSRGGATTPDRRSGRPTTSPWLRAAAAVVLLLTGGVTGAALSGGLADGPTPGAAPDPRPAFLLLIRGGPTEGPLVPEVTAAMTEWAVSLAEQGHLVQGEKLVESRARWAGASPGALEREQPVGGFFVVRAADLDAAYALASESPHLAYGGAVEVAPIDEAVSADRDGA